ncbi:MAG: FkbM family methyltransferase [Gemmatimonadota bacterium]|nr:FkbM family methyltransferase [Gemmatimonadota bacterium]
MRLPRLVRRLIDPVTERIPVPVVGGLNRGRFWNLASAGSGYATGRRAGPQMALLHDLTGRGEVFWDVGAHHGYVTLMAAARVGPEGHVEAFEPGLRNMRLLRRHLRWNRVANATVRPLALGAFEGEADFGGGDTSKMHALGGGSERVTVRTGRSLIEAGTVAPPDVVKIDVEGTEADVLEGLLDLAPPTARFVVAIHSRRSDRACVALLREHGFSVRATPELERARRDGGAWPGDPDLVAVGPEGTDPRG